VCELPRALRQTHLAPALLARHRAVSRTKQGPELAVPQVEPSPERAVVAGLGMIPLPQP
jgi:hypothetical protein